METLLLGRSVLRSLYFDRNARWLLVPLKSDTCPLSPQTGPLSPQEKFLLDEAVLHHGYDWLQLAAYVPRADASLLPKLYREACGLKSKTWKAR